jgi:malate permease and related proteins
MLFQILDITVPVLLILSLGSALYILKIHFDSKTIGILIIKIATPCLTFTTLVKTEFTLAELLQSGLAALMVMAIVAALAYPFIKMQRDKLGPYMSCLLHPNSGNLPLPLCLLAFGEAGLALAFPYFVVISVSQNTFGYAMIAGKLRWKELLFHPIVISVTAALIVKSTNMYLPNMLLITTSYLGYTAIPLPLLLLGYALPQISAGNLKKGFMYSFARLAFGVIAGLSVIYILGLSGMLAGVVLIMASMPVALLNFIIAVERNIEPDTIGGMVITSSLMMITLIPVLVWVVLWMFPA